MNLREYQRLAMRTANMKISNELILANRALGLAGEGGEFAGIVLRKIVFGEAMAENDVTKELGDVMWYAATTAEAVGLQLADLDWHEARVLVGLTMEKLTIGLFAYVGHVADHMKKHLTHGHPMQPAMIGVGLAAIVFFAKKLAEDQRISFENVLATNIDKLKKRYPEGFDETRSKERAAGDS